MDDNSCEGSAATLEEQTSTLGDTILSIDQFLEFVGQMGRFQILVLFVSSFLFVLPAHQALYMIFVAVSPPWICSGRNPLECNTTKVFYGDDVHFNLRCKMNRFSWTYKIEKPSYSIVSEVRKSKIDFLYINIYLFIK